MSDTRGEMGDIHQAEVEEGTHDSASALEVKDANDEDNSFFHHLERSYQSLKDASAGVLMLLSRECGKSFTMAKIGIVIEAIQLYTFALSPLLMTDKDGLLSQVVYFSDVSNVMIHFIGFELCLYLAIVMVSLVFINTMYVGYCWHKQTFNVLWPIKLLRVSATFFVGVAFIPTVQIFSQMALCSSFDLPCSALQPVVISLSVFFIMFALAIGSIYFDSLLTSKSPQACAHTRITVLHIIIKIILSGIHSVQEALWDFSSLEVFRHFLVILSGVTLTYLYVWMQPFYSRTINTYFAGTNAILSWLGIVMFFRYLGGESSGASPQSVTATLGIGLVLVIPLTLFCMEYRIRTLCAKSINNLSNSYEFELRVRTFLNTHHPAMAKQQKKPGMLLGGRVAPAFDMEEKMDSDPEDEDDCETTSLTSSKKLDLGNFGMFDERRFDENVDDIKAMERVILNRVRQAFEGAIVKFAGSTQICMFHIYFLKTFFDKERGTVLSRHAVLTAKRRKPMFDVEFGLFKLRSELQHNITSGKEVVSFVECEKYEREAKLYDRLACWQLLEFWQEFHNSHPDMNKIQKLSKTVADYSSKATKAYQKLTKLQPRTARTFRLFGGFLNDVTNDKVAAAHALNRAAVLEDDNRLGAMSPTNHNASNRSKGGPVGGSSTNARLDPVIIFEIGGRVQDSFNFGEITFVNADAAFVLNNVSHKIVGRSIEEYLVAPFGTNLVNLVNGFFNDGWSPFFGKDVETFLVTTHRCCCQVSLRFAPYTTNGVDYTMFLTFNCLEDLFSDENETDVVVSIPNGDGNEMAELNLTAHTGYLLCSKETGYVVEAANESGKMMLDRFCDCYGTDQHVDDIIKNFSKKRDHYKELSVEEAVPCELASLAEAWKGRIHKSCVRVEEFSYLGYTIDKVSVTIYTNPLGSPTSFNMKKRQASFGSSIGFSASDSESGSESEESDKERNTTLEEEEEDIKGLEKSISFRVEEPGVKDHIPRGPDSVVSGGSGMTSQTTATTAAYLRKVLTQENSKKTSPMLRKLHRAYVSVVLTVVICTLIYYMITEHNISLYETEVAFLNKAGFRRMNSVSIAFCVNALVMLNTGYSLPNALNEETLRQELVDNMKSLKDIEKAVFSARYNDLELLEIYNKKLTPVRILQDGKLRVEYKTLYDATSLVVGLAGQIAEKDLAEFTYDNPEIFLLMNQLYDDTSYFNSINRTTFILQELAEDRIHSLVPLFWGSVVFAMVLQTVLLLHFIWPLVGKVENKKLHVLEVLRSLPLTGVEAISRRCMHRLIEVHDVASDVIDTQFGKNHETRASGKFQDPLKQAKKRQKLQRSNSQGIYLEEIKRYTILGYIFANMCPSVCERRPPSQADAGSKGKNKRAAMTRYRYHLAQAKSSFKAQLAVVARLSMPFWVALVYYISNYFVGFYNFLPYLIRIPTSVNYSGLRRATIRYVKHYTYLYLGNATLGGYFPVGSENVTRAVSMFENVQQTLFGGTAEHQGLLKITSDADQLKLLLLDGCYKWVERDGVRDASACESFNFGIMTGGLNTAVDAFTESVHTQINLLSDQVGSLNVTSNPDLNLAFELETNYLQNQFISSVVFYVDEVTKMLQDGAVTRNIIMAVFLVVVGLLYLTVVRGVIRTLDNELKRTRKLLLMIPIEQFTKVPALREFLKKDFQTK